MALLPAPSLSLARLPCPAYSLICTSARLGFFPSPLAQAYPRATPVLIDELHASPFKSSSNDIKGGAARLTRPGFQLVHSYDSDSGFIRKLLLAPTEKSTGSPRLLRRNHPANHVANE
jgi:hypothetical protein